MIKEDNSLFCNRCYYHWDKRSEGTPKYCPHCKSPYWNKRRIRKLKIKKLIQKVKEQIIRFHDNIIETTGGLQGTRDDGGIGFAVTKLLDKIDKNPKAQTKLGSFILHDFATRHYFNDGNKRTAYFTSKVFMLISGCHLKTDYSEAKDFFLEVAKEGSTITLEQVNEWIEKRCEPIDMKKVEKYLKEFLHSMVVGGRKEWEN
jgi:death-on-curing protein